MSSGGKCSASDGVSSEVSKSQAKGNSSTMEAGISTRCHGLKGRRSRRGAGTIVVAVMSGST